MVTKDKYFVVVSVLEGRRFPRRGRHLVTVEARFDGELLATDPVPHSDGPDFTQELAWELDKKSLHQHKLQRSSIKVQVYAQDTQTNMREPVGYVVLDLRSAGATQNAKWVPLLHSKYSKNKPELRIGIYVDENKGPSVAFKAAKAPARPGQLEDDDSETLDPKLLKPELNELDGFYQIGPAARCADHFTLSVTIAFAANLPQLIPTSMPLPPNSDGFFFYFSLLGNDVTNEPFHNLLNPSFPAERASVRVRSSCGALRAFLSHQPGLQVHLCCGDQSLGSCEVALSNLLKKGSTEIYMKPVSLEGAFTLEPPNRHKSQLSDIAENLKPVVGVSIVLRKDEPAQASSPKDEEAPKVPHSPPEKLEKAAKKQKPKSKPAEQAVAKTTEATPDKPKERLPSPLSPHDGSYSETFDSAAKTSQGASSLGNDKSVKKDEKVEPRQENHQQLPKSLPPPPSLPMPNFATVAPVSSIPGGAETDTQPRHFSFSIDLRSIKDLDVTHPTHVFLRYTYPFFGSIAPIMTHPPVEIRRGTEVLLPQGYCAFDFATSSAQLHDVLTRVPLLVEVWQRERERNQTTLLGAVQLPLSNVFGGEQSRAVHQSGNTGVRLNWTEVLTIFTSESPGRAIGELNLALTMEDWGLVAAPSAVAVPAQQQEVTEPAKPAARETEEYKAAMELELWKEQQENAFQQQLKEKESAYMKALAEEWKKREKEREVVAKKKLAEYEKLEERLRKTLLDLEKRDRQLAANEQEVLRTRADQQRDYERKMADAREASRRMKEDCDHLVQLEKAKIASLEEHISKLKGQVTDAESKYQALEKDFTAYKERENSKPEVRLQTEINLLTLEKVELERKMDALAKSKNHYKQQWGRALKELARFKQREQAAAVQQLKKEKQELEHMRLRYLAAEEKDLVKGEQDELQAIKDELNSLKVAEASRGDQTQLLRTDAQPDPGDEHVTRLIEERDSLLRTGVYSTDDRIIAELDRQIRNAIATRETTPVVVAAVR